MRCNRASKKCVDRTARKNRKTGSNPTIACYNASAVKNYNASAVKIYNASAVKIYYDVGSLVRFENKKSFFSTL
jgi:hypothetical protein